MRILTVGNLYPPHHLGGYELVWQAAVGALRAAGHDVRVLTTEQRFSAGDGSSEAGEVSRELRWYWRDHDFPRLSGAARLRLERHNRAVIRRHLKEMRPQVVSWWAMGGMSLSLVERARRAGIPALGWVNDDWLIYAPDVDQWTRAWRRRPRVAAVAERVGGVPTTVDLDHAARWVFCSEAIRRSTLLVRPGLANTAVLHQGVAAEFAPAPEHPWEGRLLYAGRLDERKGLDTLIDAAGTLPGITLRVIGDGDREVETRLRARAAAAGATDRVAFEPGIPRSALAAAYAASDAVVFPVKWFEPWGLVPLEAMAVGRPVIATGQGGSGEYLEHEVNALLFPPGDAEALAAAVRRIAADPSLRGRLCEGGRATAARLTEARWLEGVVAEHEARAGAGASPPAPVEASA